MQEILAKSGGLTYIIIYMDIRFLEAVAEFQKFTAKAKGDVQNPKIPEATVRGNLQKDFDDWAQKYPDLAKADSAKFKQTFGRWLIQTREYIAEYKATKPQEKTTELMQQVHRVIEGTKGKGSALSPEDVERLRNENPLLMNPKNPLFNTPATDGKPTPAPAKPHELPVPAATPSATPAKPVAPVSR